MKKILAIILIVMLVILMASCFRNNEVKSATLDNDANEHVLTEKILYEDVITENIQYWDDIP